MSGVGATASGPTIEVRAGRSTGWWGMAGLIVTESVLFALLLFVYFYFRAGLGEWPPGDLPMPELKASGIRSALLLGSSLPVMLAERSLKKYGDTAKSAVWMFIGLAMAAVFLTGHMQEQFKLFDELSPMTTAYGATMVTILNFHAAHLIVGMGVLVFMLVHVLRGRITQERHSMLELGGLYWHFVDVIWIFVYSSLYLAPHVLAN